MLKQIPIQVWLLLVIMAVAYTPARYIVEYLAHAPSKRDITQPPADLSWRTTQQFTFNLTMLGALSALAVFIFTPAAVRFARSPTFWPILIAAGGAWALSTVPKGLATGQIEPLVRGFHNTYNRETQPKRFWASICWNALLGALCIWLGYMALEEGPSRALESRCYDWKTSHTPQEELNACNALLKERDESSDDYGRLIAARGYAYHRSGAQNRAITDYSTAIRLNPADSYSLFNRALIYHARGDYPKALADYSASIRLRPDNVDAYINRGNLFLNSGRYKKAIVDLTRAHELDPDDTGTLASRGMAYAWRFDQEKAEKDFAAIHAIEPSNPVLLRGRALLSMNANDMQGAIQQLSKALNQNPNDMWSLAMRAEAYQKLGKHDEAQADIKETKRLSGSRKAK